MVSIKLFSLVFCLFWFNRNIKTLYFGTEAKQPKQTIRNKPKQTETTLNLMKNTKICFLSNCFACSSVCFGSIQAPKLSVSVQKQNYRIKRFVSDSANTSFGSSFGCFESKDILVVTHGDVLHLNYH